MNKKCPECGSENTVKDGKYVQWICMACGYAKEFPEMPKRTVEQIRTEVYLSSALEYILRAKANIKNANELPLRKWTLKSVAASKEIVKEIKSLNTTTKNSGRNKK